MARCSLLDGYQTDSGPLVSRPVTACWRGPGSRRNSELSAVADAVHGAQVGGNGDGRPRAAFVHGLC